MKNSARSFWDNKFEDHPTVEQPHDAVWMEREREKVRSGDLGRFNDRLDIPPRYVGKSLANFQGHEETKARLIELLQKTNVFLWGPCGTGKSHLACGLLINLFADRLQFEGSRWKRPDARFVGCAEFLFELKESIGSGDSDFSLIEDLLKTDALLIDDFAACRLTENARDVLSFMVAKIYSHKESGVIITTNFSLEEIAEEVDDRTASRIAEMCEIVKLDGPDRRLQ
jgi:DNA replication protein DnaC